MRLGVQIPTGPLRKLFKFDSQIKDMANAETGHPNEYWAGFSEDPTQSDLLLLFQYLAEKQGMSLETKLSESDKARVKKLMPAFGAYGYKIEDSFKQYLAEGLDWTGMLARFSEEYLNQKS